MEVQTRATVGVEDKLPAQIALQYRHPFHPQTRQLQSAFMVRASIEGGVIHFDFLFDEVETALEPICNITKTSTVPFSPQISPHRELLSARLTMRAPTTWTWFKHSTRNVFPLAASTSSSLRLRPQPLEEQITFTEAERRHTDEFSAKFLEIDLEEYPEATQRTEDCNIFDKLDETKTVEPIIALCVAIMQQHDDDSRKVAGLLLVPSGVGGSDTFTRIVYFLRGRCEDFNEKKMAEVCIV